jgi:hypothetical protein
MISKFRFPSPADLIYFPIRKLKQSSYEYNNERSGEEASQG